MVGPLGLLQVVEQKDQAGDIELQIVIRRGKALSRPFHNPFLLYDSAFPCDAAVDSSD